MDSNATMQEQFAGQEFPGDDPVNVASYLNGEFTWPIELARSPGKVLDELGHEFKVRASHSRPSLSFTVFKVG